jgi:lipopolysaccharide/colanic/teichoic acid biosynthesis glycosyltransferase
MPARRHHAGECYRFGADLGYINGLPIWLDLKILLQTILVVFHRKAF